MIIKEAGFKSIRIFVIRDVVLGEDKKVIYLIIVKNQFSWDKHHNISILFMLWWVWDEIEMTKQWIFILQLLETSWWG